MVLGCAMLAWLRTQRVPDWLWCCALLALLFNAFATFNRMTVIVLTLLMATALVLRVTLACQPLSRKQLLTRLTVIFCAAGLLGSAGLVLISSGRFDASLKKEGVAVTTQNIQTDIRYTMWRYWTDVARNKPVFGHGFANPAETLRTTFITHSSPRSRNPTSPIRTICSSASQYRLVL